MHKRLVFIHTINHQGSSPPDIVNALIRQLLHARGFNDDIETVRVVLLELVPLCLRVLPVKFNIFVSGLEIFCNVHLDALIGSNDHSSSTIQFEELSKDKTRRTRAEEKNFNADLRVQLIEAMDSASGRLEKGRILVRKVLDLVHFLLWAIK